MTLQVDQAAPELVLEDTSEANEKARKKIEEVMAYHDGVIFQQPFHVPVRSFSHEPRTVCPRRAERVRRPRRRASRAASRGSTRGSPDDGGGDGPGEPGGADPQAVAA